MSTPTPSRLCDYLEHILEAIERATAHVDTIASADEFEADMKTQNAVVRNIERFRCVCGHSRMILAPTQGLAMTKPIARDPIYRG